MRRGGIIHAAFHRFNTLGLSFVFSPANDEFLGYKSIYQRGSIVVPYDSSPWSRVENPFHFGFRIESLLAYFVAHIFWKLASSLLPTVTSIPAHSCDSLEYCGQFENSLNSPRRKLNAFFVEIFWERRRYREINTETRVFRYDFPFF